MKNGKRDLTAANTATHCNRILRSNCRTANKKTSLLLLQFGELWRKGFVALVAAFVAVVPQF
jgi:hypothetical protein